MGSVSNRRPKDDDAKIREGGHSISKGSPASAGCSIVKTRRSQRVNLKKRVAMKAGVRMPSVPTQRRVRTKSLVEPTCNPIADQ